MIFGIANGAGVGADPARAQGDPAIARLQRALHVRVGIRHDALPARVHVPRHPAPTVVHELRRAAATSADTVHNRNFRIVPAAEEAL